MLVGNLDIAEASSKTCPIVIAQSTAMYMYMTQIAALGLKSDSPLLRGEPGGTSTGNFEFLS